MTDDIPVQPAPTAASGKSAKRKPKRKKAKAKNGSKRVRVARIYPALSFEESLPLAEAIHTHAAGERVSRLTLLKAMNLSPTSSATQILITSSSKYGLTTGSFVAEHLELTEEGRKATEVNRPNRVRTQARFNLAIKGIKPFDVMYEKYKGKKLPSQDVLRDSLMEASLEISDPKECIDTFIVNAKFIELLQSIAGSETLVPIQTLLEQIPAESDGQQNNAKPKPANSGRTEITESKSSRRTDSQWDKVCFYVTPIGEEESEQRKHSDLFLSHLIEPALEGFGLEVVRADRIGQAGMITSQVLEHLLRAKLVIADLSYHNPNVFYEMAIRHFTKLPIIQIGRKADRLPFDVNQVRTVIIDTTDIYTLVPKLTVYKAEIATLVRGALEGQTGSNPISVFFPGITVDIPAAAGQA
jgi:hypothetical protein